MYWLTDNIPTTRQNKPNLEKQVPMVLSQIIFQSYTRIDDF